MDAAFEAAKSALAAAALLRHPIHGASLALMVVPQWNTWVQHCSKGSHHHQRCSLWASSQES